MICRRVQSFGRSHSSTVTEPGSLIKGQGSRYSRRVPRYICAHGMGGLNWLQHLNLLIHGRWQVRGRAEFPIPEQSVAGIAHADLRNVSGFIRRLGITQNLATAGTLGTYLYSLGGSEAIEAASSSSALGSLIEK